MSNSPQSPKSQAQKSEYSNQPKVGNNVRKDEPKAQKKTGGVKDGACSTSGNKSSCASKPAKAS